MDRKGIMIGILTASAAVLAILNFTTPASRADFAVNSRGFQVATARLASGGDGVYVMDNGTGLIAVYTYEPQSGTLVPKAIRPAADLFGGAR
jgi:hypothetical protein